MSEKDYFKQFDPNTATGQYLENFVALTAISREQYGDDPDNKPNDHCVWTYVGYMHEIWSWVEDDEHFKEPFEGKSKINRKFLSKHLTLRISVLSFQNQSN